MKYISINEHAYCLMRILNAIEFEEISQEDFQNITDWLNMAAGVEQINVITERYDSSIFICSASLEYSNEKSKLWSKLCAELVIFNFIWGSIESLILKFITKTNEDSTTYLGRKFISKNYKGPTIKGFIEAYNKLYNIFQEELSEQELKIIEREHHAAKGLFLVSRLRNQFAHGSRLLPLPEDWSDGLTREVEIIQLSSRIILFTIQMLLLAKYGFNGYRIEDPALFDFGRLEESVDLDTLLKYLHFEDYDTRVLEL
ncbi:hypothetical protein PM3016_6693 [Paenibacillus mucilaginosus 3016]|uniref:Uncharacterized protein n=1 Tax=Paenibacillus mucilaginosus 3016 TaxID=1116391 RepID=H6NNI0_9BACL|nr:hypothetical protein [Paenibacillus mucilaginosus]AFC33301.1 hypothetical protein PM3016_6693 [Paenibacillus mucilaginosus 3016]WFA21718.1 hypothetical protein ERY13_33230 [Paenibacillus mucilaginosus]